MTASKDAVVLWHVEDAYAAAAEAGTGMKVAAKDVGPSKSVECGVYGFRRRAWDSDFRV